MAHEVQPGSWLGDGIEEFKKLPKAGKIAVVALVVGVAAFGYWRYQQQKGSGNAGTEISLGAGNADPAKQGGKQSPFGSIPTGDNQVPLLPSGINPLYSSQGQLIAFQPGSATSPSPAATPTTTTTTTPKPTTTPTPKPTTSASSKTTQNQAKSVPAPSTHATTQYKHPQTPSHTTPQKTATYVVKSGDTLSGIAAKTNAPGGWQAVYSSNKGVVGANPNLIYPGQKLTIHL